MTTSSRFGLLICQDLMFMSKVSGASNRLGLRVETCGTLEQALAKVSECEPGCIFLDLSLRPFAIQDLISSLPGNPPPPVVAFGAHVETDRLTEARLAGCREVLSRGQFHASLPEILKRYLIDPGANPECVEN